MSFITKNDGQFAYFDTQLGHPIWKGKTVLDFGGNIGNILHHPESTIDHDRYWCIDVSKDAIEAGRKAAPAAHFVFYDRYNVEYNPHGIKGLPPPRVGSEFDFILCLSVFTHTAKNEMIEMVSHLKSILGRKGRLAVTFLDPHYVPPGTSKSNLRYYLEQRLEDKSAVLVNTFLEQAASADWSALAGIDLELEGSVFKELSAGQSQGYLAFYTTRYVKRIWGGAAVLSPVKPFERQHCCVIRNE